MMLEQPVKQVCLNDPPYCEFLLHNIRGEREAIKTYRGEVNRTNDLTLKIAFQRLAEDEMHHLEFLDDLTTRLGCHTDGDRIL